MMNKRIFEIDLLRATAIVLMVIYHFVFDLNNFTKISVDCEVMPWNLIGTSSALIFIFISGISSGLSKSSFKRGIITFSFGMLVTVVTLVYDTKEYIRFGILHFLGISMMMFPLLNSLKKWQLVVLGGVTIILGKIFETINTTTFLLLPLGITYNGFATLDYYPVFPYISVFIFGIFIYKIYYFKGRSILRNNYNSNLIYLISRNSLNIYLLHQPIILAGIYFLKYIKLV